MKAIHPGNQIKFCAFCYLSGKIFLSRLREAQPLQSHWTGPTGLELQSLRSMQRNSKTWKSTRVQPGSIEHVYNEDRIRVTNWLSDKMQNMVTVPSRSWVMVMNICRKRVSAACYDVTVMLTLQPKPLRSLSSPKQDSSSLKSREWKIPFLTLLTCRTMMNMSLTSGDYVCDDTHHDWHKHQHPGRGFLL